MMSDLIHRQSNSISANSAATQAEAKETFNLSKSSAFAFLQTALNVFTGVAGKTPVPGLQEGAKALVAFLDVLQVRPYSHVNPMQLLICELRKHRRTLKMWSPLLSALRT